MNHVSLETAKKLKEAGWKQVGGTAWWCEPCGITNCDWSSRAHPNVVAPSTDELLGALPSFTSLTKHTDSYYADYPKVANVGDANPAEALALLWLTIKEKNLLEIKPVASKRKKV